MAIAHEITVPLNHHLQMLGMLSKWYYSGYILILTFCALPYDVRQTLE